MVKKKAAKKTPAKKAQKCAKTAQKSAKLTQKQILFCKEYLIDKNATQAAIRAGYSKKTAKSIGQENLTKPDIQEMIRKDIEAQVKRTEIDADKVLQEIAKLAFSNMEDYITINGEGEAFIDLSGLTRDQAACISEITSDTYFDTSLADKNNKKGKRVKKVKLKLVDKKSNLDMLMKYLNLYKADNESGAAKVTIMNDVVLEDGTPLKLKVGKDPDKPEKKEE